ncbi:hypothetical protein V8C35DRAFT_261178 [Trichoderma chlorosporum]
MQGKRGEPERRERSDNSARRKIKSATPVFGSFCSCSGFCCGSASAQPFCCVSLVLFPLPCPCGSRLVVAGLDFIGLVGSSKTPFRQFILPSRNSPPSQTCLLQPALLLPGPAIVVISSVAWCPCAASPLSWDTALGPSFVSAAASQSACRPGSTTEADSTRRRVKAKAPQHHHSPVLSVFQLAAFQQLAMAAKLSGNWHETNLIAKLVSTLIETLGRLRSQPSGAAR